MNNIDEAFFYLWSNGHRMIHENEKDSLDHGIYKNESGFVQGFTINGLKSLANKGKFTFGGLTFTPEEVDIMFNYVRFMRSVDK